MGDVPPVDQGISESQNLPPPPADSDDDDDMDHFGGPPSVGGASSDDSRPPSVAGPPQTEPSPAQATPHHILEPQVEQPEETSAPLEQTTLVQNEEESFALAPVDASALKGDGT